jgi:hypothetical protein
VIAHVVSIRGSTTEPAADAELATAIHGPMVGEPEISATNGSCSARLALRGSIPLHWCLERLTLVQNPQRVRDAVDSRALLEHQNAVCRAEHFNVFAR